MILLWHRLIWWLREPFIPYPSPHEPLPPPHSPAVSRHSQHDFESLAREVGPSTFPTTTATLPTLFPTAKEDKK